MPSFAFVEADLKCPKCSTPLTDMVWFQWGYCPGQLPRPDHVYRVGDHLDWRACDDGSIRAWVYFGRDGGNIGDPELRDLVVRDAGQVFLTGPCPSCGTRLGGGAVQISDGVISQAWPALPDEFDEAIDEVDIYTVSEDGKRVPRPDLHDHPMRDGSDCVRSNTSFH